MDIIEEYIYYLNLEEITKVCEKYKIPYKVYYKLDNKLFKSSILLRKGKIIKNILRALKKKPVKKYIIPESNVKISKSSSVKLDDKVLFGEYKWTNAKNTVFPSHFKPVLCQLMLFDLWLTNKPFTYCQFIRFYDKNEKKYAELKHPEWRYIDDIRNSKTDEEWKKKRKQHANKVIKYIHKIIGSTKPKST